MPRPRAHKRSSSLRRAAPRCPCLKSEHPVPVSLPKGPLEEFRGARRGHTTLRPGRWGPALLSVNHPRPLTGVRTSPTRARAPGRRPPPAAPRRSPERPAPSAPVRTSPGLGGLPKARRARNPAPRMTCQRPIGLGAAGVPETRDWPRASPHPLG